MQILERETETMKERRNQREIGRVRREMRKRGKVGSEYIVHAHKDFLDKFQVQKRLKYPGREG